MKTAPGEFSEGRSPGSWDSVVFQDIGKHYLSRGKLHPEIAAMMENAVRGKHRPSRKAGRRRVK
jgi:hypothetical protein